MLFRSERYADGENGRPHANPMPELKQFFEPPVFKERNLLDDLLDRVSSLDENHEARQFCDKRKIPLDQLSRLYFVDNIRKIENLNIDKYKNTIIGQEPRIVIPFRDKNGKLVGVSCRGIRGETLRYVTVKIDENAPLIFGIEDIKQDRPFFAVEGPIDSLFVENSIAVGGVGFNKLDLLSLNKDNLTVVLDNQPRNSEVCKVYRKLITQGYRIMIWPLNIESKDINDLALAGYSREQIKTLINDNSFQNMTAQLKFDSWKKI